VFGRLSREPVEPAVEDTWILPGLEDRGVQRDVNKLIAIFDKKRLNQTADKLAGFNRPALIAWSREDKVFPPEHGQSLAWELPHARLEWVDGARTLSMEDQPERVAELIGAFVLESERAVA
jgi:pimeloyl-ACP methyl ester carboxylesterase